MPVELFSVNVLSSCVHPCYVQVKVPVSTTFKLIFFNKTFKNKLLYFHIVTHLDTLRAILVLFQHATQSSGPSQNSVPTRYAVLLLSVIYIYFIFSRISFGHCWNSSFSFCFFLLQRAVCDPYGCASFNAHCALHF